MNKNDKASAQTKPRPPKSKIKINWRWVLTLFVVSFFISASLNYVSDTAISGVGYLVSFLVLGAFILLGILFDIIGIAAASADDKSFHSMASKRVSGAKESVWLIRNAEKVSSFCNDVVGDISGIISGATGAVIILRLSQDLPIGEVWISLTVTGLVAALTIGGKAAGKGIAMAKSNRIIFFVGRMISVISFSKYRRDRKNG